MPYFYKKHGTLREISFKVSIYLVKSGYDFLKRNGDMLSATEATEYDDCDKNDKPNVVIIKCIT